jgi:bifunctional UDP-N-acetylglucosamine pyrophosphorylase/glucosamine-1-phosphate N-acetyltransferase
VSPVHVVILAAGKGTRMKSLVPKVLHRVAGRALIDWVLDTAAALTPATVTLVVGHEAAQIRDHVGARHSGIRFAVQEPQLGTGHALLQAEPLLAGEEGSLVLLSGDVPMLRAATLRTLLEAHRAANAAATVVTAVVPHPYGYGRIVRSQGRIARIVEERDASPAQRKITEINSGIFAFDLTTLFATLKSLGTGNAQGEYYLTDLVAAYRRKRRAVATMTVERPEEVRGINSRSELAEVSGMARQQKNEELMAAGVTLIDPATAYIDAGVEIGADTVVHPCVVIEGSTRIGAACEIHAGARIVNSTIGDRSTILNHSVIVESQVSEGCRVGPFAHLRPGASLGDGSRVGNFVELKKTTMGAGAKANHLAYLGDSTIGAGANIGAGTIMCNYDGVAKHHTTVGARAFVGSNSTLVAPVTVGDGAYVAAGSAITEDVPADALAIGRARQVVKPEWAKKRRESDSA